MSAEDCLEDCLFSILDHPNLHTRLRAADVIEWAIRQGGVQATKLVDLIAGGEFFEGRELAIGVLH